MMRLILLNPGPVTLSDGVRGALVRDDVCHREPEFAALTRHINARLVAIYPALAAHHAAVTLASSGTGAVEAMLATFAPDVTRTLVVANGVYGERMARMLDAHGKPHEVLAHDWCAPVDIAALRARLAADAAITHLAVVHHETTTGRLNDLAAIGALCAERGVELLLDAVSSFGAEAIEGAAWNLAALAATANKCLHGAPGLSFVIARDTLWRAPAGRRRSVYLDLHAYHAGQHGDGYSPFTLPVHVAHALDAALDELAAAGGWSARQRSYRARARRIGATLEGLGLSTLLPVADCSAVLWSWRLPPGQTYTALHDALKTAGFVIYAGQGALGPAIFRIAHMGEISEADLERLCEALVRSLGGPP